MALYQQEGTAGRDTWSPPCRCQRPTLLGDDKDREAGLVPSLIGRTQGVEGASSLTFYLP